MAALLFALPPLARARRPGRLAAAAALAVLAVAAGAVPASAGPGPVPLRQTTAVAASVFVCEVPGSATPAAAAKERPATALRVALGAKLGEHAYLLMEAMRAAASASADAGAITATLNANSDAIAAAIGSVYGDAAGTAFRTLWQRHIDAARAYGDAVRTKDTAARDKAGADLDAFKADLDAFLRQANPQLNAADEAHAVSLHLQQLRAYADGDYAQAYRVARQAYNHMYELGDMLARAVARQFPDRFPDERVAFSPASELRIGLDRLLGEHLVLAAEAMRSSISASPDTAAARQSLDANGDDLSAAVASVYGDAAGSAFSAVWRAHLDAYLEYIDALGAGDTARADAARASLTAYGKVFGDFMAKANPRLSSQAVSQLISHHTQALLAMVDAYRSGNTDQAYQVVGEAYDHMFTVGDALATAIAAQFPKEFKDLEGAPATDTTAHVHAAGAPDTSTNALGAALLGTSGVLGVVAWLALAGRRRRSIPSPQPVRVRDRP